ncbi:hypothetical protein EV421DRAFT_1854580 [Armillaria borealis]|uniref:Uncharacterized protein n=1 Tax=Armillaria borealis TaxID=47425 RepID=A0AA39MF63_9AGAR|nr:hypothetical protein EV421DRAFT_1854580 [Armillaria borealis]
MPDRNHSNHPEFPPEILDAIVDELKGNKHALIQISLVCRDLYPRTRVHLLHSISLSTKADCDRLRALITLSPKLAVHFKHLHISCREFLLSADRKSLKVIEPLINITSLHLESLGFHGPEREFCDSVWASLCSHSYHTIQLSNWCFAWMDEFCALMSNSTSLYRIETLLVRFPKPECNTYHPRHPTTSPIELVIDDLTQNPEVILESAVSPSSCPYSFSRVRFLKIRLGCGDTIFLQRLNKFLDLPSTSLKNLYIRHFGALSETPTTVNLNISRVENLGIRVSNYPESISARFDWWIANFKEVDHHNSIHTITFVIFESNAERERRSPLASIKSMDAYWSQLDECLASPRLASLRRVAIIFEGPPLPGWEEAKMLVEGEFTRLKQLGRELALGRNLDVLTSEAHRSFLL